MHVGWVCFSQEIHPQCHSWNQDALPQWEWVLTNILPCAEPPVGKFHNPNNSSFAALPHAMFQMLFDYADGKLLFFFALWNMHLCRCSNLFPALGLCHLFCFVVKVICYVVKARDIISLHCSVHHQQPCLQQTLFPQWLFPCKTSKVFLRWGCTKQ